MPPVRMQATGGCFYAQARIGKFAAREASEPRGEQGGSLLDEKNYFVFPMFD